METRVPPRAATPRTTSTTSSRRSATIQAATGLDLADLCLAERLVLARQGGGLPARPYGLTARLQELLGLYCWRSRPELAPSPAQEALYVNRRGGRLCDHRVLAVTRECGELAGLPGKLTVLCLRRAHKAHRPLSLNREPKPC